MDEKILLIATLMAGAGVLAGCRQETTEKPPVEPAAVSKKAEPQATATAPESAGQAAEEDFLVWAEAEPDEGPPPLTVRFTVDPMDAADLVGAKYEWDFGDGSPVSTEANPTHTYQKLGTYEARLKVTDPKGRFGTDIAFIYVEEEEAEEEGDDAPQAKEANPA